MSQLRIIIIHINQEYKVPNKPDEYKLKRIQFKKYIDGIKQETKYNINDNVRFLKNKVMFSKGSLPSWSSTIHKIENKNLHSYILDNGKHINIMNFKKLIMFKEMKKNI